ncbi:Zinc-binding oxidoreductase alcohol dehydrogenase [Rhodosporidiobolus nylandii]
MNATMKATIVPEKGKTQVVDVPVPSVGKGQILVKAKHRDFITPPNAWLGCDFAGVVEKVGEGVTNVKEGDRVAGFVHGGLWEGEGSFAEKVVATGSLVWKVPENVPFEEAAAAGGIGPWTAIQALYMRLGLAPPSAPTKDAEPILVWGGSTSVGLYAVQLLKLSGYKVIATASEKNWDLVKSFGANEVYSYSDPATPSAIAKANPTLSKALDTISEKGTTVAIAKAISEASGKGHVVTLLPVQDEGLKSYEAVKVEPTLVYTVLGVAFNMMGHEYPVMPDDKKQMEEWLATQIPSLFASGKLRSNPVLLFEGGLEAVPKGLDFIKEGKNSAQKVVFKI